MIEIGTNAMISDMQQLISMQQQQQQQQQQQKRPLALNRNAMMQKKMKFSHVQRLHQVFPLLPPHVSHEQQVLIARLKKQEERYQGQLKMLEEAAMAAESTETLHKQWQEATKHDDFSLLDDDDDDDHVTCVSRESQTHHVSIQMDIPTVAPLPPGKPLEAPPSICLVGTP
jgi:hypothetical protein